MDRVKALLPKVNPSQGHNRAFINACAEGHLEVVRLLLSIPGVDPADLDNSALKVATVYRPAYNWKLVRLLLQDDRVRKGYPIHKRSDYGKEILPVIRETIRLSKEETSVRFLINKMFIADIAKCIIDLLY